MNIRTIIDTDWPAILGIQSMVYPDITPESEAVLRSKIPLGVETCLGITDKDNNIIGYCLAHPWVQKPASLHTVYQTPSEPHLLYIHNIAIAPELSGKRIGQRVLQHLQTWAINHGFREISLVSLQQAVSFWQQQGFQPIDFDIDTEQYGEGACYMRKQL